jgi:membrane-associated PAP2 superfamily phosphatase
MRPMRCDNSMAGVILITSLSHLRGAHYVSHVATTKLHSHLMTVPYYQLDVRDWEG